MCKIDIIVISMVIQKTFIKFVLQLYNLQSNFGSVEYGMKCMFFFYK